MAENIDYNRVAAELIRVVRGTRSQIAISRKLGYRTNQLYRWEAGFRAPSWKDFVKLCRVTDSPMENYLKSNLFFYGEATSGSQLVKSLMQNLSASKVATLTGISRFSISRWCSGKNEPHLADVLCVMHRLWNLLFVFLDDWIKPDDLPSLGLMFHHHKRELDLFFNYPSCIAIIECFKLESYKRQSHHSDPWVANTTKTSLEETSKVIAELSALGLIEYKNNKYLVLRSFSSRNGNFLRFKSFRKYWFNKTLNIYDKHESVPENSLAPMSSFACSQEAMQLITTRYKSFLVEMKAILAKDENPQSHLMVHSSIMIELTGG